MSDRLLTELHADPGREAGGDEIGAIREHVAEAGFLVGVRVPRSSRGLSASGYTLGEREDSLIQHLVRRIVLDEQWVEGTTPGQYLVDLRAAVEDASARFGVGKPAGNSASLLYVFADNSVPERSRGPRAELLVFVLYGVADAAIITGHMASSVDAVRKADDFRWLR